MSSPLGRLAHDGPLQDHWIRRAFATLVDFLLLYGLMAGLTIAGYVYPALAPLGPFGVFGPYDPIIGKLWGFFFGLVAIVYFTLLEGAWGRSAGKAVLGLRVVAADGPPGFARALMRNASKVHWVLLLLDTVLGFVTVGDPRQRLLDRVVGTTVTRTGRAGTLEAPRDRPAPQAAGQEPAHCRVCGGDLEGGPLGVRTCRSCGAVN